MTDDALLARMASAIQAAKIHGQRQRMSDEYCREMARAALEAVRESGYAVVKQEDLAELRSIILGVVGAIDATAGKET